MIVSHLLIMCGGDKSLTQVMIEKKEKATTARAASAGTDSFELVLDHWLARTQKQMNHSNVQAAAPCWKKKEQSNKQSGQRQNITIAINLNSAAVPIFEAHLRHTNERLLLWNLILTWEDQIPYDNVFSLVGIADLREVAVQYEKDDAGQEGQDTNPHAVAAGAVILVEHAMGVRLGFIVIVAFCRDGCKDHDGK